ncbi:MAG: gamma-glutamyltransferase [Chloroflexota bacterium]|nr:gamma-glutamyltransferase [Chloroflexota bacterium]
MDSRTGQPSRETYLRVARDLAASGRTMVAAKHPWAVHAALDVLDWGGNAVDAAVTAAFAIGVVEPWMSGIGGVGFMTVVGADGRRAVVDYFGRAPQAATPDMYELTDPGSRSVVGFGGVRDEANAYGPRSVLVPGMVAGMALALDRFGTIGLDQAVAPAAAFADEGFPVDWYYGLLLSSQQATIRRDPETERIFLRDGVPPAPLFGQPPPRLVQPDLARTLRLIAERGPDGFYHGEVAERMADHIRAEGGILTADDLARYEPRMVDPLILSYRDDELVLLPFQAGGVTVGEAFNILDGMDLRSTGHNTAATLHAVAEASRRAHADRLAYVGDPGFVAADWDRLTSTAYAAERRAEIDLLRASSPGPGRGIAHDGAVAGDPAARDEGCTTHLCVVDGEGTMVSVTQTLTLIFGSAVTVPGTGVLLNDSMNLFDPVPGRANSIAPGKRPASSMAHIVALRDGTPILTVGAPGGRRIMDTCLQVTLNVLEFGLDPSAACAAPLIDCSGPELLIDDRIPAATRDRLRAMGHDVVDAEVAFSPRAFASPAAVAVDPATGIRFGGADPFGAGIAAGR